jgi:hypothetical protein
MVAQVKLHILFAFGNTTRIRIPVVLSYDPDIAVMLVYNSNI